VRTRLVVEPWSNVWNWAVSRSKDSTKRTSSVRSCLPTRERSVRPDLKSRCARFEIKLRSLGANPRMWFCVFSTDNVFFHSMDV
jgi:hypothetical protein